MPDLCRQRSEVAFNVALVREDIMADKPTFSEIQDTLKQLDTLFESANDFALGENGFPKNGTVAVCLHKIRNLSVQALRALADEEYSRQLSAEQMREHAMQTMLTLHSPGAQSFLRSE